MWMSTTGTTGLHGKVFTLSNTDKVLGNIWCTTVIAMLSQKLKNVMMSV